jgi:p24 family protein delta-1
MVFAAIPSLSYDEEQLEKPMWISKYKEMEGHFFNQILLLSKSRKQVTLPKQFLEVPPEEIKSAMDSFIQSFEGEIKSGIQLKLTNPESSSSRTMDAFWFTPLVVNHIRKAIRTRRNERESSPLEGYSACLTNSNDDYPVHVIVDSVLTSEEFSIGDDAVSEDESLQGSHLTPLAEQLAESMAAAKSIIKEMNYMERRESRMRLTADSINARVRYFSYISVGVLLIVTYIQVTYLKRYFKKKKLL